VNIEEDASAAVAPAQSATRARLENIFIQGKVTVKEHSPAFKNEKTKSKRFEKATPAQAGIGTCDVLTFF
jgi:hypothetical protein